MDLKEIITGIRDMYTEDLLSAYQKESEGVKELLIS
jgi:hypothetical protein